MNGIKTPLTPKQQEVKTPFEETRFQKWSRLDNRRRELLYFIKKSLRLIKGRFSYQREKGLDQILTLLHDLRSISDVLIFSHIHKQMNNETNGSEKKKLKFFTSCLVVMCVVDSILKKHAGTEMSPISVVEYYKALLVIEGCCLLSTYCSSALTSVQGLQVNTRVFISNS